LKGVEEDTLRGGFGQQAQIILIAIGARKSGKGSCPYLFNRLFIVLK